MFEFIKELSKLEVEFEQRDFLDKKISFKSYVKSVESDYILIDFLFFEGEEYIPSQDELLNITFRNAEGVYTGDCRFISKDDKSNLHGLKISFPTNINFVKQTNAEYVQQREYVRVSLKLDLELIVFVGEAGDDINFYNETTLDVSGSGLCFITNQPIEEHNKIIGIISFSKSNESPIKVLLKQVYSRPFEVHGKERYKNAFTFAEIIEKDRDKLLREIHLFQIELRKKGV